MRRRREPLVGLEQRELMWYDAVLACEAVSSRL